LQRGDLISVLATFGALRFPRINIWEWLRRSTMLTELMDELIEDSPFLRQIHDDAAAEDREEGREEGHLAEARTLVREVAQARFPELTEADLVPIEAITSLDRLHALARDVVRLPDAQALRQALADAPGAQR
jgi:predicted transposase YdaD